MNKLNRREFSKLMLLSVGLPTLQYDRNTSNKEGFDSITLRKMYNTAMSDDVELWLLNTGVGEINPDLIQLVQEQQSSKIFLPLVER